MASSMEAARVAVEAVARQDAGSVVTVLEDLPDGRVLVQVASEDQRALRRSG